jgi:hypothetical protein
MAVRHVGCPRGRCEGFVERAMPVRGQALDPVIHERVGIPFDRQSRAGEAFARLAVHAEGQRQNRGPVGRQRVTFIGGSGFRQSFGSFVAQPDQEAVNDAFLVCRFEGASHRRSRLSHSIEGQPVAVDEHVERLPAHQLHRQEIRVGLPFHRIDGDDVRVVQCGEGSRFAAEALDAIRVGGKLRGKDFQRHVSPERGNGGAVDGTHPATPDESLDRVAPERAAGIHERRDLSRNLSGRGRFRKSTSEGRGHPPSRFALRQTSEPRPLEWS